MKFIECVSEDFDPGNFENGLPLSGDIWGFSWDDSLGWI